jgi:hypothetical protein
MTVNQALQLLYLHQKKVLNLDEPPHSKRRRGESSEAYSYRLGAMHRARQERDREAFRVAEAARLARGEGPYWSDGEQGDAPQLPDLAQVTGWSKADATKTPHDDARALFGGWRIGEGADRLNGPRIRDTGSDPSAISSSTNTARSSTGCAPCPAAGARACCARRSRIC